MPFLTINFPKYQPPISTCTERTNREIPPANKQPNNRWREQHEELIKNIRAARKFQAFVKDGGKICDLPPSENQNYVQCPHCLRRFSEKPASRHIPKCVEYKHNKPKSVTVS